MVYVEERSTKKLPGLTSLFVNFDYNPSIVEVLKTFQFNYDKSSKEWEISITQLDDLLYQLSEVDEVECKFLKEKEVRKTKKLDVEFCKTKPFPYQEEGINFGLNHDKWLLLDSPGLGKTLQTILLAEELKRREGVKHCLIVCGVNMLKSNWLQEIEKHSILSAVVIGLKRNKKGRMVTTSVRERIEQLKSKIDDYFVIINIEMLRNKEVVSVLCNKKYNQYDMIICDEIHKCKDPSAEQTKGLLKLKAKHVVGLTGTLLLNDPIDAYMPMKWIGEEKSSMGRFKSSYYSYGGLFGNEIVGYKNLDYLRFCLSKCSLRRPKDILGLDEKNIIVEHLDMNDAHQTFYNNIVEGVVEEADKVELMPANVLSMVTRLRQATSCPSILTSQSNVNSTKIDRAVELCDSIISSNEKVVIFSMYKETVYELQKRLNKYNPVVGTGDLSTEEIERNKDLFQNNPNTKVFIGTFAKMSTGITLTAASYMICIDSNWTQADNTQAEDRIYRIGTKGGVFIYYLVCKNTIDEKVLEIVNNKSIVSDFVVDNKINPQMYTQLKTIITDLQE